MISKFARLPEQSIWKTDDPAYSIAPYVLRNELIENLSILRREKDSPLAEKKIQELLKRGSNVQDPEWNEIHNLCSSKTIEIAHRVLNPLTYKHSEYFCPLDYILKAGHQNDPQNLIVLKKALGHEKSLKIDYRIANVPYVDLDTLMIALKIGLSDRVIEALYNKFRAAPFFEVCNKDCLANHIFNLNKPGKMRDSNLVLTILRDVSNIRSEPDKRNIIPTPLFQAVDLKYSDEIVKTIIGKIENFNREIAFDLLLSNTLSKSVLEVLKPILGTKAFSKHIHHSIGCKKEEEWILKLLEFTDHIKMTTLEQAAKQGYSSSLLDELTKKTHTVSSPLNNESHKSPEGLNNEYSSCRPLYFFKTPKVNIRGRPFNELYIPVDCKLKDGSILKAFIQSS